METHITSSVTRSLTEKAGHLYVLWDDLSFCPRDKCLGVGPRFQPERDQPADEDDPSLKEALFGAVHRLTTVLLPAHYAVVGFRTHGGHICTMAGNNSNVNTPVGARFGQ